MLTFLKLAQSNGGYIASMPHRTRVPAFSFKSACIVGARMPFAEDFIVLCTEKLTLEIGGKVEVRIIFVLYNFLKPLERSYEEEKNLWAVNSQPANRKYSRRFNL